MKLLKNIPTTNYYNLKYNHMAMVNTVLHSEIHIMYIKYLQSNQIKRFFSPTPVTSYEILRTKTQMFNVF